MIPAVYRRVSRSTERHVHDGALPGHPRGERGDLVQGDLHVEADATLGRPAGGVVQHPDPRVHLDLAIVEHRRARHDDLLLRLSQHLVESGLEVEQFRRAIEPRHHRLEGILLVEKAILVRLDDGVRRESQVGGHEGKKSGPGDRRWSVVGR
jgi:hypothetical protein